MEKFIRKDGIHVRNIQDADKMKTCILLLERLMNDIYHDQAFKKHYEKWGDPLMRFIDCEHEDCHEIIFDYKNVKTEKYGRLLCDVYLGNQNLNLWMLEQRYAVKYDGGTKKSPSSWEEYHLHNIII